jgi:hypothetical protein
MLVIPLISTRGINAGRKGVFHGEAATGRIAKAMVV